MKAITATNTAALVLLLAAAHIFVSVNSWSIIQPSSFITTQRLPNINSFRSTVLQLSSSNNNDDSNSDNNKKKKKKKKADLATQVSAMGLNELQTQFRLAIAREDMDAAILYRDELANRVDGNNIGNYNDNDNNGDGDSNYTEEERLKRARQRLSWSGLGTAPWLIERLDALDYTLPTTIQINAMEAVNAILADNTVHSKVTAAVDNNIDNDGEEDDSTLEERLINSSSSIQNMGLVISGSTGSGKTLAYLVPTLSTLSQTLFTRQRIRIKAEEDVGDLMGDLLERVMVQTSPSMRGQGYEQVGGKLSQPSTLGKSGTDVKSPIALIVVPTRELGVQTALLLFELVGGNKKKIGSTDSSGKKNMFKYKGPKGVKIGCVLDDEVAKEGLKLQTDIAITTPQYLSKLIQEGDVDPSKLRVVIYDEADLGLEQTSDDYLKALFDNNNASTTENTVREFSRISYLVGATVTESLGNLAVRDEILPRGRSYIATATRFAPLTDDVSDDNDDDTSGEYVNSMATVGISSAAADGSSNRRATLKDLNLCLDPGLCHERVVATDNTELLCLARMLRKELEDFEIANATLTAEAESGGDDDDDEENDLLRQLAILREETKDLEEEFDFSSVLSNPPAQAPDKINSLMRPKVVVFFSDEDEARDAILSLRDAMWGEHKLGVLLPNTGTAPLSIMESFKKGDISVLLATPNSIRGLDFPELTHVYTLFLPDNDPREYLHLAGRVGRIGQQGSVRGQGGKVTTILDPEEASKYDRMASFLGFDYVDVAPIKAEINVEQSDVEDMRRYLEDTITLLGTVDDKEVFDAVDNENDDENGDEEVVGGDDE
jgi:superfamily II DNA/RNA helicase